MKAESLFCLYGKIALVTGAAGGLGSAIAEAMAHHGATVIISDRDKESCATLQKRFNDQGYRAFSEPHDLSDSDGLDVFASQVEQNYGPIDVLVCNAGVQGPAGSMTSVTSNEWKQVMDINLRSAFKLSSLVAANMAERGHGSIILVSSIAGLRGNSAIGLYGISKAGLAQLARNLAVEWGPSGVRANAISPGLIRTPFASVLMNDNQFMERRLSLTPLRRVGEPEEVAGAAIFLASAASGFVTGQNLVVDGGTMISDGS